MRATATPWIALFAAVACTPLPAMAQPPATVAFTVHETQGIRRNSYPVNARVPFPAGALAQLAQTRLRQGDEEVAAQVTADSRWPDGSVQWLLVDFNASLGPEETRSYRLDYGAGVSSSAEMGRGLPVVDEADAVQVGRVRVSKTAVPLIRSVRYRDEVIGPGPNGFIVSDAEDRSYPVGGPGDTFEIVRGGPLYVELRYSGRVALQDGAQLPFVVTLEMPNSKSWVRATAAVEDPDHRLRSLSFHSPLSVGPLPWVWDFGTDRWTYGALRDADSSVVLRNAVEIDGVTAWRVDTGPKGQERPFETTGATRPVVAGWGHVQGPTDVVAFAVDQFAAAPGTYAISLDGAGHAAFSVAPAGPTGRHRLSVYQHFVSTPVQIGAATSPPSMLHPLEVLIDDAQYTASGLPTPQAR